MSFNGVATWYYILCKGITVYPLPLQFTTFVKECCEKMNGKKLRNHAKRKGMVRGVCVMKVGKVFPYTALVATTVPPIRFLL